MKETVRPQLPKKLIEQPAIPVEQIKKRIEALVDEHLEAVVPDCLGTDSSEREPCLHAGDF